MAITATDIISENEVEAILEERTQAMYQFRRAFRDDDATDINSAKKTFPQAANDVREEMDEVGEESDYPRSSMEYDGIDAEYTKDGFEIAISDEAADDSVIDVVLDLTEEMGIAAEGRLDSLAFNVLAQHNNDVTVGTEGDRLNFEAVVDAYAQLTDDEFNPANFEVYCSPFSWADLAKDPNFNRATDQGDALARNGMLGEAFGTDVALTNTGALGATEAIMVDTGMYGYESTRWAREVTSYREEKKDRDVFKIRHRKDHLAMKPDAAIFIEGGVSEA